MNARESDPAGFLESAAAGLDAVEFVPDNVLWEIVTREGSCMVLYRSDRQPEWSGEDLTDQETAARICAGCPVQRECLELELRTSGAATMGVWGVLRADDVRALYPVWRSRREDRGRSGEQPAEGGGLA